MTSSQVKNLISMLNQISDNNNYKKTDEEAAKVVANHIKKFWAPSMRDSITKYSAEGGSELSNISKLALTHLK
jgi:formate dehydrogenase subunit delta